VNVSLQLADMCGAAAWIQGPYFI